MKISSIKIKGLFDENFDVYLKADGMEKGCDEIFCSAANLSAAIDFIFANKRDGIKCDGEVKCEFEHDGVLYGLSRTKSFDTVASVLRCDENGVSKRYTKVDEKLAEIFKEDVAKLFDGIVIEADDFGAFNQNPVVAQYGEMAELKKVVDQTQSAYEKALDRKNSVKLQLKTALATPVSFVKSSELEEARRQTAELQKMYFDALSDAAIIKDSLRMLNSRENLQKDIENTQNHIDRLNENSSFIDEKRKQLEEHKKIQNFLPQLKEILLFKKQMSECRSKADSAREELEWLKSERQGLVAQTEELNNEINRKVEQNTRLMLIRNDSESVESLTKRNDELADRILEMQGDKERLEQTRDSHRGAIEAVDKNIEETKDKLKAVDVPVRSINELVESVRLSVRIKEVEKQLQQADDDLTLTARQITEREGDIKKQQETITALLQIDAAVTPFKSKDTILQMLQSKISKGEVILQSLNDKQHNLREEIQNLHYKEIEIDQSADCIQTILSQKQFDRDMVIKKQAISEQQSLPLANGNTAILVAPTTSAFIDEHIESLKSDLVRRNNKKLEIVSRQAGLKYVLNEVERQKQIVLGDIVSCRNERDAVLRRFRELAKTSESEVINRYFTALDAGKATNFVMDIQRGLVENQTQLAMLREKYQATTKQKQEILARLGSLSETQQAIDIKQLTVDMMVESNEQVKSTLVELTEKLVMLHTQRKMESDAIDAAEMRLANITASLNDVMNEKKSNEKEILKINQKVSLFVKGQPDEAQQAAQEKVDELVSEKKLLEESRAEIDDKILAKSVEIEKNDVVLNALMSGYESKKASAQTLMKELGDDDIESIKLKNLSDESYASLKDGVERFDATMDMLTSRLQHLQELYDKDEDSVKQSQLAKQLDETQSKCDSLQQQLAQSREKSEKLLDRYIKSDRAKTQLRNLLSQYDGAKSLDAVLQQTKVVKLVFETEINKLLASAGGVYRTLCGQGEIVCDDGKFAVKTNGVITPFDKLSLSDKLCLFLSLKLCAVGVKFPHLDTVLLHGDIQVNKEEMASRLKNLKNKNFITEAMSVDL